MKGDTSQIWYRDGQSREISGLGTLINASNPPPSQFPHQPPQPPAPPAITHIFIALKHPIFPAFEDHFFPTHRPLSFELTTYRYRYLTVCDRRLANVSSLRMGCPSASQLPIGDRGPAAHIVSRRRNVSQCSVPTKNINIVPPILFSCVR